MIFIVTSFPIGSFPHYAYPQASFPGYPYQVPVVSTGVHVDGGMGSREELVTPFDVAEYLEFEELINLLPGMGLLN